jgi:DNA-binding transcriptional ArsR family regulator
MLRRAGGAEGCRARLLLSRSMEKPTAISALSALAHEGRLDIFRLLVRAGAEGMAAGEIARTTGAAASTQSVNLAILSRAGLIASRRDGRSIIYAAAYDQMRDLLGFLMEDCCGGRPEICTPLAALVSQSCAAEGRTC